MLYLQKIRYACCALGHTTTKILLPIIYKLRIEYSKTGVILECLKIMLYL